LPRRGVFGKRESRAARWIAADALVNWKRGVQARPAGGKRANVMMTAVRSDVGVRRARPRDAAGVDRAFRTLGIRRREADEGTIGMSQGVKDAACLLLMRGKTCWWVDHVSTTPLRKWNAGRGMRLVVDEMVRRRATGGAAAAAAEKWARGKRAGACRSGRTCFGKRGAWVLLRRVMRLQAQEAFRTGL